uniref:Uncharacterized protein n=1 Tax=Odontella aurita TaxID=265563 RepID=A0A7S4JLT6_9STRA|mmetsp:Transcript_49179/g.148011  ORF Transcript_49179/g.148011 Transcript_49179/m.148011 type:complete len:581 (+) Transcript_49179:199-1941(+)
MNKIDEAGAGEGSDIHRLQHLLSTGDLVHPFLAADYFNGLHKQWDDRHFVANFTDLAHALAFCCGVSRPGKSHDLSAEEAIPVAPPGCFLSAESARKRLVNDICAGRTGDPVRRHIIFILCDGMGNDILERHLQPDSFLLERNDPNRVRAVFPSTTPAALTTFATAEWPGQHGMPGWDLQDKKGCDFPDAPAQDTVQIRVLAANISDVRSGRPASEQGFDSWKDIFVVEPWASLAKRNAASDEQARLHCNKRRMIYINAYNGDEVPGRYQGDNDTNPNTDRSSCEELNPRTSPTDFSSWQMGAANDQETQTHTSFNWSEAAHISETSYHTLGEPEGSKDALRYFRDGINSMLEKIKAADTEDMPTFSYLYFAHPDKHMHALGVDHPEVGNVVRGIDREIYRLWEQLGQFLVTDEDSSSDVNLEQKRLDASVIVTADHGHVTVDPEEMVALPQDIIDCLEYANLGVHGKGRHAYLHCRSGLQSTLKRRWEMASSVSDKFLLLTIEEAASFGLWGPIVPNVKVRPRMGDFVAISTGPHTLVSPKEASKFRHSCPPLCQGAHGSLLPAEMEIPFILLVPSSEK